MTTATNFIRNSILLAKEESVYGQDPTPTVSANAMEVMNLKVDYEGDILERNIYRGTISQQQPVMGSRTVKVSFDLELKGSGTAGTAPRLGDLFEACGFAEYIGAAGGSSSVVYSPTSEDFKSVTFYIYEHLSAVASKLKKITGARGSFNLICEAGQYSKISFSFEGAYNVPTDVARPADPTYEGTLPPVVASAQFTLNGNTALIVQSFNVDLNNSLVKESDLSSPNGVKGFVVTERKAGGTLNPEAVSVADYDFYTDWANATAREMSCVIGSVPGNIIKITAPKVTFDKVSLSNRDGIRVEDLPFRCSVANADDELAIKFF
jgi:hypothetical protein